MIKTRTFRINESVKAVWSVLGDGFDRIGEWATSVPSSTGSSRPVEIEGAPSAGRTCTLAVPGFSAIEERLVRFEPETYTLAYEVTEGMPVFVESAVNTWALRPLDDGSTEVTTSVEMTTTGLLGRLATPAMGLNVSRTQSALARDLTSFVETGRPSPAKQRQLANA